jgi:hypothetical protein
MTPLAALLDTKITLVRRSFSIRRFRYQERLSRLRRGLAYAFGMKLPEDAMHAIRVQMNQILSDYPLMTLGTEDVLEESRSRFGEEYTRKLVPYFDASCQRIARQWESDDFDLAIDWALEDALAYAAADGIELTNRL